MDYPAWDPVLLDLPGPLDIRWYGLMYVVGFLVAQWILVRLARARLFPVDPRVAPDLIFYCVIGVMLGGRTGYALFYDHSLLNPLQFVQVWKGGLAFHGGLSGVAIAAWLFARKHNLLWTEVGDACALAVTPGIFAVRMANFINGELYGRKTDASTLFAMQFPTDPEAKLALGLTEHMTMRDQELCIQVAFGRRTLDSIRGSVTDAVDLATLGPRLVWEQASVGVPHRHPSQLYEGFGEGLVLGLVLLAMYLQAKGKSRRPGAYIVTFLLGYAVIRWSLETVRQPDAQFGPGGTVLLGMTMGQTLSTAMVLGAIAVWCWPKLRASDGKSAV